MPIKAGNPPDQTRIVATLASQCHTTISEMTLLYERERARLALGAHIIKFLDVFTTRHILESFRFRAATQLAAAVDASAAPDRTRL